MNRRAILYFFLMLVFSVFGAYMYVKGSKDGVRTYKHSKSFYMTLDSMYRCGLKDCK